MGKRGLSSLRRAITLPQVKKVEHSVKDMNCDFHGFCYGPRVKIKLDASFRQRKLVKKPSSHVRRKKSRDA